MRDRRERREFLYGSLAAAAWTTIVTAGPLRASAPLPAPSAGAAPPTQRFLEAVVAGDLAAVREALGSDPGLVHLRDEIGRSAFALALLHYHTSIATLLRERGHTPDLHESALDLDWERFESLAERTPTLVNQDHPIGGTAMYAAAIGGAATQIWRVYQFGGDPNEAPRDARGRNALRAALEHPDLSTAELTAASLLANGASPGGPQLDGSSPLHAAAARGSLELVEMLIRKNAELEARDARGRTALDLAEEAKRERVAAALRAHREIPRDHSTSRTAYDVDGNPYAPPDLSALSVLARGTLVGQSHGNLVAVQGAVDRQPLLAHSVATTTEGAVEAGAHMGRRDIVDYLLGHGAPYSLPTAVMCNDLTRARVLLEQDPLRIHERGAHDFPLLWYPVIGKGLLDMAELLLEYGAEVERQHWLGTTALHFAAAGGQVNTAGFLLDHGADPARIGRMFDSAGQTPLQVAEARGHDELAKLLRDRGARR